MTVSLPSVVHMLDHEEVDEPADGLPGPRRIVKLSQRKFFPAELEALVSHAGFRVVGHYGDFSFENISAGAESQVLVCEKAPIRRRKTPLRR